MMVRPNVSIDQHPDIAEMRARYERVAETTQVQSIEGLVFLAGVYLAASPWIVGFRPVARDLAITNLITGIAVALLAVGHATAYGRTHGLSWATPAFGIWTIVAPWVVLGTLADGGVIANNVVTGALITLLGVATMAMAMVGSARARRASRPA
jgi:SPW repeat